MTDRLYYNDAYISNFDAHVAEVRPGGLVRLDKSAFYPTSGGQPHDTGTLNGIPVTDVFVEGENVWHKAESEFAIGEAVHGEIHWPRRFDHMQQHGGEHLLAGEVFCALGGHTMGLHLGQDDSTIDCALSDGRTRLTDAEIDALEDAVNARIQSDAPCRSWFPLPEELAMLPLRKPPTVAEHVRVVAYGDFEMVACGGTHPSSAGQIGLLKILDVRPARGKVRITFACGMRAVRDYRARFEAARGAASLLSASVDMLPGAVERLKAEAVQLRSELLRARREGALRAVAALPPGPVMRADFAGLGAEALREAANLAVERGAAALVASLEEDGYLVAFARPDTMPADMAGLMRESGVKGGGRPDFAQGRAADLSALDRAEALLRERYHP